MLIVNALVLKGTKEFPAKTQRRKEGEKKPFKINHPSTLSELSLPLCAFARNFLFLFVLRQCSIQNSKALLASHNTKPLPDQERMLSSD
jgi:hypothetical protein